ncbi:hypothetical protein [Acetobacter persici]|uniref:Uncharacterized protein n=1 Tax=Acetobacter persici TaxID=1076596 RepID=A0A6V8IB93_9PROT|nr:hypothetical protein [Acetobacter persici]GFE94899.1 hypothetical protein DmAi_29580 [Acetobacter persici]
MKLKSTYRGALAGALLLSCVGLAACKSDAGVSAAVQRQQTVFALGKSYDASADLAVAYEHNPAAKPAVVSKIKAAFQTAHDKIKPLQTAAEAGDPLIEAEIEAAQAAFQAAQKLIPAH